MPRRRGALASRDGRAVSRVPRGAVGGAALAVADYRVVGVRPRAVAASSLAEIRTRRWGVHPGDVWIRSRTPGDNRQLVGRRCRLGLEYLCARRGVRRLPAIHAATGDRGPLRPDPAE